MDQIYGTPRFREKIIASDVYLPKKGYNHLISIIEDGMKSKGIFIEKNNSVRLTLENDLSFILDKKNKKKQKFYLIAWCANSSYLYNFLTSKHLDIKPTLMTLMVLKVKTMRHCLPFYFSCFDLRFPIQRIYIYQKTNNPMQDKFDYPLFI